MSWRYLMIALMAWAPAGLAGAADATYPVRPVRFLVPAPPGGTVDLIARLLSPRLGEQMGQQFVVDNRAGAGGVISAEMIAKAAPDGYTISMVYTSYTTNAVMRKKPSYDPLKDIAPISMVSWSPLMLVAYPGLGVNSVRELIALARTKPLFYGSAGSGSGGHMCGALFSSMAKVSVTHVPYKGAALATNEVVAGQVAYQFAGPITVLSLAKAGRLRLLAVTSLKRVTSVPDVPTLDESGVPGFEVLNWFGVVAPSGTPKTVIQRLRGAILRALESPDVRSKLTVEGSEIIGGTPEEFGVFLKRDLEKWAKVVATTEIKPD